MTIQKDNGDIDEESIAVDSHFPGRPDGWPPVARRVAGETISTAGGPYRAVFRAHARRLTLKGCHVWRAPDLETEHTASCPFRGTTDKGEILCQH